MCFYILVQIVLLLLATLQQNGQLVSCVIYEQRQKLRSLPLQKGTFKRAHHCPMDNDIYKCFAVFSEQKISPVVVIL